MAIEERNPKPADDWPDTVWLQVRFQPGDTPRAIRMRHWLKIGLRTFGIKAERLTGKQPEGPTH
ncbi:MAG: hypothetical protein EXS09_21370 [Gemmataceae bacterium]|nr:hypothetical protein [Gemmataceae bacterium]